MCGIIGYAGKGDALNVVVEGLKKMEYRGYDSWGVASSSGPSLRISKYVGGVGDAQVDMLRGGAARYAIGHTRWATHGKVCEMNAHPHHGCRGDVAIVHNGIVSNYSKLKGELEREGHVFNSECDSEVFAHLLEGKRFLDGLRDIRARVKGSYALLALSKNEEGILAARDGSPLVLGAGDHGYHAASDVSALVEHTRDVMFLEDGESALLNGSMQVFDREMNPISKRTTRIEWDAAMASKGGHPHFMLKEILEEPHSLRSTLAIPMKGIDDLAAVLHDTPLTYLIGMGTSMHAALTARYWLNRSGVRSICVDASELRHESLSEGSLVIGVTQSGETKDTLDALKYAKECGATTASVVNVMGSSAARLCDHPILQGSGPEISVCATKTYLSQLMVFARLSNSVSKLSGNDFVIDVGAVPALVSETLSTSEKIKRSAKGFCTADNYFFIGRGIGYPSALEAALKFKEISYKHAEAMSAGFLKHGTISLIDDNFHTIALIQEGNEKEKMESNVQEILARGGNVLRIGSGHDCDIRLPPAEEQLSPFLFGAAGQLLAYHYADLLGRPIDKPRNLAKSVTVE